MKRYIKSNSKINYPWKMYAEFEDGYRQYFSGDTEDECWSHIVDEKEKHGDVVFYTGYNGDGYIDGEYIGTFQGQPHYLRKI